MKTASLFLGLAIALYGAYGTGKTRVACSRPTSAGSECRVEVLRWMSSSVVERGLIHAVHGAATRSSARRVTDNPTAPLSERTTREVRERWLVLTGADGTWLKQLEGGQEQVERARGVLAGYMARPTADEVSVDLDVSGAIYIGVGVFVFLAGFAVPRRDS